MTEESQQTSFKIETYDIPVPKTNLVEKARLVLDPKLSEIKHSIDRLKGTGIKPETAEAVTAISIATQKVIEFTTNTNFRLGRDFSKKFKIGENGQSVERIEDGSLISIKTPQSMIDNFTEIAVQTSDEETQKWILQQSIEHLTRWISLAAEVNPQMVYNLKNIVDHKRFGIKSDRVFNLDTPQVIQSVAESDFARIPESELPERIKLLRNAIDSKFGEGFSSKILLCGGTARDIVTGKDPTIDYEGDFDYATTVELDEKSHDDLEDIVRKYIKNSPDEMTGLLAPFRKAMLDAGAKNITEMLEIDREFSINKFAINLGSGEIIDPHGGVRDLQAGVLRLVGKNISDLTMNEIKDGKRPGIALILALRGVRFASQYGLTIDKNTAAIFQKSISINEFGNRFAFQFSGPNQVPFFSEISKTYLKMLEKTQNPQNMLVNMGKLGILHQFVQAVDVLNFQASATQGATLKDLSAYYSQTKWKEFVEQQKLLQNHERNDDIRTEKSIDPKTGLRKFLGTTAAAARMFSYVVYGA